MMYYAIQGLCPRNDISMGAHGFSISLHPEWKDLVAKCELSQEKIDRLIEAMGRTWLDACGFNAIYDPDNCGAWRDKALPPGPNARPMYSHREIRVSWGEWGAEHITVPGNACGLDIERHSFNSLLRGPSLTPHNIDCWSQKQLFLIVFCEIANDIILFSESMKSTHTADSEG